MNDSDTEETTDDRSAGDADTHNDFVSADAHCHVYQHSDAGDTDQRRPTPTSHCDRPHSRRPRGTDTWTATPTVTVTATGPTGQRPTTATATSGAIAGRVWVDQDAPMAKSAPARWDWPARRSELLDSTSVP